MGPALAELQQKADTAGQIDWEVHYVDGTNVRAHQDAAGAKRGGQALGRSPLGRSRGRFGTRVQGAGKPVVSVLTPGQRHKARVLEELMTCGEVRRPGRGRPRIRPLRVCGDKGYSRRKIRAYLRRRGIRHAILRKRNEWRNGPFDWTLYRTRNPVERAINRLKQFRRIANPVREEILRITWRCCTSGRFYAGYSWQTRPGKTHRRKPFLCEVSRP